MMVDRGGGPWPSSNLESLVVPWLVSRLHGVEPSERSAMSRRLLENVSGKTRGERLTEEMRWSESQLDRLALLAEKLNEGRPLQYVLEEAWFDGFRLYVSPAVLIPRPETEELVMAMANKLEHEQGGDALKVLDWCTGSGCMALSLKRRLPAIEVHGYDVSEEAIQVAKKNAADCDVVLRLEVADLLLSGSPHSPFDAVMSNPPYIPGSERTTMHGRVTNHEPELALFVPDEDPLVFYLALEHWCKRGGLKSKGWLGVECHARFAEDVASHFRCAGGWKHVEILEDMQGLPRHVIARLDLT